MIRIPVNHSIRELIRRAPVQILLSDVSDDPHEILIPELVTTRKAQNLMVEDISVETIPELLPVSLELLDELLLGHSSVTVEIPPKYRLGFAPLDVTVHVSNECSERRKSPASASSRASAFPAEAFYDHDDTQVLGASVLHVQPKQQISRLAPLQKDTSLREP